MKNFILNKLLSKKFIGWLGACAFLYLGKIPSDTWLWITLVYMGMETGLNIIENLKKPKESV